MIRIPIKQPVYWKVGPVFFRGSFGYGSSFISPHISLPLPLGWLGSNSCFFSGPPRSHGSQKDVCYKTWPESRKATSTFRTCSAAFRSLLKGTGVLWLDGLWEIEAMRSEQEWPSSTREWVRVYSELCIFCTPKIEGKWSNLTNMFFFHIWLTPSTCSTIENGGEICLILGRGTFRTETIP